MNKKLFALSALLSVGLLVGCGGGNGGASSEAAGGNSSVASVAPSSQASATVNNVATAIQAANALAADAFSSVEYTISGYVVGAASFNSNKNSYTFNIADTVGGTTVIKVYGATLATNVAAPDDGDKVTIKGYITNFKGNTPEFSGSTDKTYPVVQANEKAAVAENAYVMKYTGTTTANMTSGNNATSVGLDASIFNVTSTKYTTQDSEIYAGLNKDGTMRLYAGQKLTIAATGVTMKTVKIVLSTTGTKCTTNVEVKVNGTAVKGTNYTYTVNASTIEISNSGTTGQVWMSSITITY